MPVTMVVTVPCAFYKTLNDRVFFLIKFYWNYFVLHVSILNFILRHSVYMFFIIV